MSRTSKGFIIVSVVRTGQTQPETLYIFGASSQKVGEVHGRVHEDASNRRVAISRIFFDTQEDLEYAGYAGEKHRGIAFVGRPTDNVKSGTRFHKMNTRLSGGSAERTHQ
jgi:hypothetical protein